MCFKYFIKKTNREKKKEGKKKGKKFKSLFLPTHNCHTIGPHIIILVPEDSICSNKRPQLLLFLDLVGDEGKSGRYHKNTTSVDDSYHNEWLLSDLV